MAFKTVLTPGIDQPLTMTLTKNTLDTKMTQQHKG